MNEPLQPFVLAELFRNSLVIAETPEAKKITHEKEVKKIFQGDYKKKVAVLIKDEKNSYIDDESLHFLTGILNACKLNIADIALININKNTTAFLQLKKEMRAEFIILFGVTALQIELPFTMPDYQVQQYDNCSILTAPPLNLLNSNAQSAKTEKIKLWKSLQKMFDLK